MRKVVIAGNWKMHKTKEEVEQFIEEIQQISIPSNTEAIVCSPFPYLSLLVEKLLATNVKVAAQTMHEEDEGAFTGEVSGKMLADIGVTHVVIGHSERREYYNETDVSVNKKVHKALEQQLTPIICVGETLEQRESNKTLSHIENQVAKALENVEAEQVQQLIIAYEPIWAIGTGKTASSADANEVCNHIRHVIEKMYSLDVANNIVIQYGGSVKPTNIDELLNESDIDGALVGGASLEASSFIQLVEAGNKR